MLALKKMWIFFLPFFLRRLIFFQDLLSFLCYWNSFQFPGYLAERLFVAIKEPTRGSVHGSEEDY